MASLLAPVRLDDLAASDGDYLGDIDDNDETGDGSPSDKPQKWKHEKLIRSIARLDKPISSHKKIQRSEPAKTIGDQDVSTGSQKSLSLSALLKKFDNSESDKALKKKLHSNKETKVLPEPLRKIEAAKLKRTVAYEEVSKDLKKWDSIVKTNRVAEGVSFPLDQTKLQIQTASEYVKRYQTKTPLEQEIEELLHGSRNNLTKATILTEAEREALDAMSLQEADFRRQELQKNRALLSYKEQKARWQSKIKSKGYHRHLRRAKRKIDEKEFEELQKTNPDALLDKLEGLDKQRIQERLTLKHRNMGKWARHMASRAKTSKEAREVLQEQLRLSRSLAEKLKPVDSDTDDEAALEFMDPTVVVNEEAFDAEAKINPWMSSAAASSWEDDAMDQAFADLEVDEQRREKEARKPVMKAKQQQPLANRSRPPPKNARRHQSSDSDVDSAEDDVTELTDSGEMVISAPNVQSGAPTGVSQQFQKNSVREIDVDPSNLILASKPKIRKTVFSGGVAGQDEADSEDDQRGVVAEAFADDDVMEEFSREKLAAEQKERPKDIDLTLPGWGDWAGAGIGANAAKKKKFTVKAPKAKPRKDRFLPNVIISERHDEKIVPHQIRELPFPFTTVAQLHSTIRAPIGKTWNTESAFEEMTKPKYTTKMGVVIQPLNPKLVLKKGKRKAADSFGHEDRTAQLPKEVTVAPRLKTAPASLGTRNDGRMTKRSKK